MLTPPSLESVAAPGTGASHPPASLADLRELLYDLGQLEADQITEWSAFVWRRLDQIVAQLQKHPERELREAARDYLWPHLLQGPHTAAFVQLDRLSRGPSKRAWIELQHLLHAHLHRPEAALLYRLALRELATWPVEFKHCNFQDLADIIAPLRGSEGPLDDDLRSEACAALVGSVSVPLAHLSRLLSLHPQFRVQRLHIHDFSSHYRLPNSLPALPVMGDISQPFVGSWSRGRLESLLEVTRRLGASELSLKLSDIQSPSSYEDFWRSFNQAEGHEHIAAIHLHQGEKIPGLGGLFARWSQLRELRFVDFPQLESIASLGALHQLEVLGLEACPALEDLGGLHELPSLRELQITYCQGSLSAKALAPLCGLEELGLDHSPFLEDTRCLEAMTRLKGLSLVGHHRLDSVEGLADLQELEFLDLCGCRRLEDIEPLAQMHGLRQLSLRDCRLLTRLGPLAQLPQLEDLDLRGCGLLDVFPHRPRMACRQEVAAYQRMLL